MFKKVKKDKKVKSGKTAQKLMTTFCNLCHLSYDNLSQVVISSGLFSQILPF